MKNALFEGAAAHRSANVMARDSTLRRDGYPAINLTTFEPQQQNFAPPHAPPLGHPQHPRLTLHEYRKQQLSPVPSSPADQDYKRIRRKPSFSSTSQDTSTSTSPPPTLTSSTPLARQSSVKSLLPSLLPPSPLTPTPRLATSSPSLSSTVDTLPSTASHTSSQEGQPLFGRWQSTERGGLSERTEPIRTKRKLSFKQAKRLPHPAVREAGEGSGSSGIWQIHAAIIDIPTKEQEFRDFEHGARAATRHVTKPSTARRPEIAPQHTAIPGSDGKRARYVRFKEESDREWEDGGQQQSSSEGITSSYSLSKFRFPAPPGHHWTGTFGKPRAI